MVSITDIAKLTGVSISTVSRVINGSCQVNAEKRTRILKLIEETGYVPNKAAQNMVLRRTFSVGLIIPDTFNIFQRQLFSIVEHQLESLGYHSMFFFVQQDAASEKDCLSRVKSEKLDGLLLFQEIKDSSFFDYITSANIPAVFSICNDKNLPAVTTDDIEATREGMRHLIGLGHRRIAMLCGNGFFSFGEKRIAGYRAALEEHGLPFDSKLMIRAPLYNFESGMYCMRELLLRSRNFSAVFASTDELAIGALRALQDEGLRVPDDISVLGFDDIDLSSYVCPRLTTISQPLHDLGEQATRLLHRLIDGKKNVARNIILPHRLIIRESTHAAPF
ncbi:MAG: LacI family transcriptional regulator [Treponema sp.]|jgi:LacI family transcriptional regulator|nr:LacI family transcriptional regulator [Treponema sp.]